VLEVEMFALRASTFVVPVVVTDKLVKGGAVAPIVPVNVKLSVAVIVKACAPLIVPEIVCCPPVLLIKGVDAAKVISPE